VLHSAEPRISVLSFMHYYKNHAHCEKIDPTIRNTGEKKGALNRECHIWAYRAAPVGD
jgi:hypothetical protein